MTTSMIVHVLTLSIQNYFKTSQVMTEIKFLKVFLACFLDNLDSAHPNSTGLLSLFLDEERTGGISIQKGKCI